MATRIEQNSPPDVELLFGTGKARLAYLGAVWLETRGGVNRIPSATVVLAGRDDGVSRIDDVAADAALCKPGVEAIVQIKLGPVLFSGIVIQQEYSVTTARSELTLRLGHPLQRLTASHRSRIFESQTDAQILTKILQSNRVKTGMLDGLNLKHAQMIQFECSDWAFVASRVRANGVWLLPTFDGVDIVKPKLAANAHHTLSPARSGSVAPRAAILTEEACWQFSSHGLPQGLDIAAWDVKEQKMSRAVHAAPFALGSGGLDPARLEVLAKDAWTWTHSLALAADEQAAASNARLLAQQACGVQARFSVMGSTAYQPGETLAISGFGAHFDGSGIITEVKHTMSLGTWRTELVLGQDVQRDVGTPLVPSAPGLHIGIVGEYKQDPENLNRLRVKVPSLQTDDTPLWARFAAPYASKERGLCFYPEPGDEVVLGFFAEDPRYPVILGSMHNPKNKPPYAPSAGNNQKGLVLTQGGNEQQLLFDTKAVSAVLVSGKEKIALQKGAKIESDGPVQLAGSKIDIAAKQQVNLQGQSGVQIKGAKVDLSN